MSTRTLPLRRVGGAARHANESASAPASEPAYDCDLCPRLVAYRQQNRTDHPDWFNGPAPSFGAQHARFLIVGLAPGLNGANRTGRPFTGDYAGDLLYGTLSKFGLATGVYDARPDDGLALRRVMISNAVRCAPPANKPTPLEIRTCRSFLAARIASLPHLRAVLCLGRIAHDSTIAALGETQRRFPFAHGARHRVPGAGFEVFDSYHCSRYNTNTGRLTREMFETVFANIVRALKSGAAA